MGKTPLACRIKRMEAPREGDLLHREYFVPDTDEGYEADTGT
jgi:hypothetical protein